MIYDFLLITWHLKEEPFLLACNVAPSQRLKTIDNQAGIKTYKTFNSFWKFCPFLSLLLLMYSSWHVNVSPLPSYLESMDVSKWVNISQSPSSASFRDPRCSLCPHAPNSISRSNSSSLQCDQIWAKSNRHQSFWVPHTNPTLFLPSRGKRN